MLLLSLLTAGCSAESSGADDRRSARELTLVSYAVTSEAYEEIVPAFQKYWKDRTGEDVRVTESYGGSGSQARAVADGLDADVVHLAMEPDVQKIVEAGLIDEGWQSEAKNGAVPTTSLIVFGVRSGNPEGITDWSDLTEDGVGIVTPDPLTSGGAQWNVLGAYGSVMSNGGTDEAAFALLVDLFRNTVVLDKNGRDATNTFLKKRIGDAAILWESDALVAKKKGDRFDVVYPANTVLAETAVAVVDTVARDNENQDLAEGFVAFLFTPEAQKSFAQAGLRPVDETVLAQFAGRYPSTRDSVFTVTDFGGWEVAEPQFFADGAIYDKVREEVRKR